MTTVHIPGAVPDLSGLSIDSLRDVWQTDPDPGVAEQAHVRLVDRVWSEAGIGLGLTRMNADATYALF